MTWNTTKLIAAGSLGILLVLLALPGATINLITGTTLIGGFINSFLIPLMLVICLFLINEVGAATVMLGVFGVLAIPLPLQGTPGFFLKVPIVIVGGIIVDIIFFITKKNKILSSAAVGGSILVYLTVIFLPLLKYFQSHGLKMATDIINISYFFLIPIFIIGGLGGLLGYLLYGKIKNTNVVRRIQGN